MLPVLCVLWLQSHMQDEAARLLGLADKYGMATLLRICDGLAARQLAGAGQQASRGPPGGATAGATGGGGGPPSTVLELLQLLAGAEALGAPQLRAGGVLQGPCTQAQGR